MLAKVPLVPGLSAMALSRPMAVRGMTSACLVVWPGFFRWKSWTRGLESARSMPKCFAHHLRPATVWVAAVAPLEAISRRYLPMVMSVGRNADLASRTSWLSHHFSHRLHVANLPARESAYRLIGCRMRSLRTSRSVSVTSRCRVLELPARVYMSHTSCRCCEAAGCVPWRWTARVVFIASFSCHCCSKRPGPLMNFGFLHRFLVATTVVVGGSLPGSSSRVGPLDDRDVAAGRAYQPNGLWPPRSGRARCSSCPGGHGVRAPTCRTSGGRRCPQCPHPATRPGRLLAVWSTTLAMWKGDSAWGVSALVDVRHRVDVASASPAR